MPRFAFDFRSPLAAPLIGGIGTRVTSVRVENGILDVRFALLRLRTPVSNIADATVTGPFNPLKTLGVHMSLADRGLTFGTTSRHGLCVAFIRPVVVELPVPLPVPLPGHPAVTLTVAEPIQLRELLLGARDAALAEQERLVSEATPVARPRRRVGPGEATRARAGRGLDAVRPAQPPVQVPGPPDPAGSDAPAQADDSALDGDASDTPARRRRAARRASRKASAAPQGAAKSVDEELAARRLAGNLPQEEEPT